MSGRCDCCGITPATGTVHAHGTDVAGLKFSGSCVEMHGASGVINRIRERLNEKGFYGTMPEKPPQFIPSGAVIGVNSLMCGAVFPDGAEIRRSPEGCFTVYGRRIYLGESYGDHNHPVCEAVALDWSRIPIQETGATKPTPLSVVTIEFTITACAHAKRFRGYGVCEDCGKTDEQISSELVGAKEPICCRKCNAPAAFLAYGICAYCAKRGDDETTREMTDNHPANIRAGKLLVAALKAEQPKRTATSRELAKPHPW